MKSKFSKNRFTQLAAFTVALTIAGTAYAQMMKPEDAIKTRKAGYAFMAWNMGKIKSQVEAPQTYKKDDVLKAAQAIAAINNSGMGALYLPGTDKDVNGEKTRVKPELFTDKEGVAKVAKAFSEAANNLVVAAESGNIDTVKTQFGQVGEQCKACHDKYRKE